MNDANEVQEPSVFDLLLFCEEAGGALDQGAVHPPKSGPAGHRAVRGNHEGPVSAWARGPCILLWSSQCPHLWAREPELWIWIYGLLRTGSIHPQAPRHPPDTDPDRPGGDDAQGAGIVGRETHAHPPGLSEEWLSGRRTSFLFQADNITCDNTCVDEGC